MIGLCSAATFFGLIGYIMDKDISMGAGIWGSLMGWIAAPFALAASRNASPNCSLVAHTVLVSLIPVTGSFKFEI